MESLHRPQTLPHLNTQPAYRNDISKTGSQLVRRNAPQMKRLKNSCIPHDSSCAAAWRSESHSRSFWFHRRYASKSRARNERATTTKKRDILTKPSLPSTISSNKRLAGSLAGSLVDPVPGPGVATACNVSLTFAAKIKGDHATAVVAVAATDSVLDRWRRTKHHTAGVLGTTPLVDHAIAAIVRPFVRSFVWIFFYLFPSAFPTGDP